MFQSVRGGNGVKAPSAFFVEGAETPREAGWEQLFADKCKTLIGILTTDEVVKLGATCKSLHDIYCSPRVIRASVHRVGPSEALRFSFWKKALRVEEVQTAIIQAAAAAADASHDDLSIRTSGAVASISHKGTPLPQTIMQEDLASACMDVFMTGVFGNKGDASDPAYRHRCLPSSSRRLLSTHGQEGEIARDITRTFPTEHLFSASVGVGQALLASVLKACSTFHDDVGYCQGMNFVVATFLFALRRRLLPAPPSDELGSTTDGEHSDGSPSRRPPSDSVGSRDDDAGYNSDHSHGSTKGVESSVAPEAQVPVGTGTTRSPFDRSSTSHHKPSYSRPDITTEQQQVACDVFWAMTSLMSERSGLHMRMLWHPEVPHMKLRVFQFDRMMTAHLPKLHQHFRQIRLAPDILVTQWLMTLLAYCLPIRVLVRVWDVVFLDGWKALFRICLALLQAVEEDLLPLSLEESGRFLRNWTCKRHPLWRDPVLLLRAAMKLKVTRSVLRQLTEEFYLTLLKEQLAGVNTGEWLSRYGPGAEGEMLKAADLGALKAEIRGMELPISSDFAVFRQKIEAAGAAQEAAATRLVSLDVQISHVASQIEELQQAKHAVLTQISRINALLSPPAPLPPSSDRPNLDEEGGEAAVEIGASASMATTMAPPPTPATPARPPSPSSTLATNHSGSSGESGHNRFRASTNMSSITMASISEPASLAEMITRFFECVIPQDQLILRRLGQSEADPDRLRTGVLNDAQRRQMLSDLALLEKKVVKLDRVMLARKDIYIALQMEREEAQVSVEEAETSRNSISSQLHQLLSEVEERVNKRMREVVRSQPSHRSLVPSELSPNPEVLKAAGSRNKWAMVPASRASMASLTASSPVKAR